LCRLDNECTSGGARAFAHDERAFEHTNRFVAVVGRPTQRGTIFELGDDEPQGEVVRTQLLAPHDARDFPVDGVVD
jgi:hypothetical protein